MNNIHSLSAFKVVLFGAGRNAKPAFEHLINNGIKVAYFVDNNSQATFDGPVNGELGDIPIYGPEILLKEDKANLKIIITPDFPIYTSIKTQLQEMGLEECLHETSFLCCERMLRHLGYYGEELSFCCDSSSNFHEARPTLPYLDTAEATILNFLQKRKAIVEGNLPAECVNCSKLRLSNMPGFNDKISSFNISCYPSICQAKCIYCNVHSNPKDTLKNARQSRYPKMITEMIQYLQKNNLITDDSCCFVAPAEISIMPHKDQLLEAISKYKAVFATNAFIFEPRIADSMKKNGSVVNISIDSGTKETFKLVKGCDIFEKVMNNLKQYKAYGTFILKYNILSGVNDGDADIDCVVQILKELDLKSLHLSFEYNMPLRTAFYPIVKFVTKLKESNLSFSFHSCYTPSQIESFIKLFFNKETESYYAEKYNHLQEIFRSKYFNDYDAYKKYVYQLEIKELIGNFKEGHRFALITKSQRIASYFQELGIPSNSLSLSIEEAYDEVKDSADIIIISKRSFFKKIKVYVERNGGDCTRLLDVEKFFLSFEPAELFLKNNIVK